MILPHPNNLDLCHTPLHPLARKGIELFNRREYFEAHEALESAWKEEPGPVRELYRGILQVAVAYYHLLRGNYIGARKMLIRCKPWLAPFPDWCRGVDIAHLRANVETIEGELIRLGPNRIAEIRPDLLEMIRYDTKTSGSE